MNRIEVLYKDFREMTNLEAAHIVWNEPQTRAFSPIVLAYVPEPQGRMDKDANWNEEEWRSLVRQVLLEQWGEPDSDVPVTIYLVFDPGRDQTEEEVLVEWKGALTREEIKKTIEQLEKVIVWACRKGKTNIALERDNLLTGTQNLALAQESLTKWLNAFEQGESSKSE